MAFSSAGTRPYPPQCRIPPLRRRSVRRSAICASVGLMDDTRLADAAAMSDENGDICTECGSDSIVASGVLEQGTWIQRLTCWTCKECRSVVLMPQNEVRAS